MKKNTSSPYRTMELKKIEAPKRPAKDDPKGKILCAGHDLRAGGKK